MSEGQPILHAEGFFPSENRWLFYRYWRNSNSVGDIIAIHGAGEHSGRYKELGITFAEQGYNFYTFDLRGHGRSEGKRGHIEQYEEYLVDIGNFYAFLRDNKNMRNPFVLGHSVGGLLGILFALSKQCFVKGLILSGPLIRLNIPLPIWKKLGVIIGEIFLPGLAMENQVKPEFLSHDPNIVEDYVADPFIFNKVTLRWFKQILKAAKNAQKNASHINIPSIILHGEKDYYCDYEGSRTFFEAVSSSEKELYIICDSYHEVFNEIAKEKIMEKVFIWLEKYKNHKLN